MVLRLWKFVLEFCFPSRTSRSHSDLIYILYIYNLCVCAQSCLTLCDPLDCSPPGSSVHGIFPARSTWAGCHFLFQGIFPTQGLNPRLLCLLHWQADYQGFPNSSVGKEYACSAGDPSWIPGSGRSTGEVIGYPLQYSGLENSINCIVHRAAKNWTPLSDFHFSLPLCHLGSLSGIQNKYVYQPTVC